MDTSKYSRGSVTISGEELQRGLRPSKRAPRNSGFLIECVGMVGRDGILQAVENLSAIDFSGTLDESFPRPQIFVLTNVILVCTPTKIYEYDGSSLTEKISVTTGNLWEVVDFYNFLYMSNGVVSVIRDGVSLVYSVSSTLPVASAICNFNGQVIVGVA